MKMTLCDSEDTGVIYRTLITIEFYDREQDESKILNVTKIGNSSITSQKEHKEQFSVESEDICSH